MQRKPIRINIIAKELTSSFQVSGSGIPWVTAEKHSSSTATTLFKADVSNLSLSQSKTVSHTYTYIFQK